MVAIATSLFQENNGEMMCDADAPVVEELQDESSQESMSQGSTDDDDKVVEI